MFKIKALYTFRNDREERIFAAFKASARGSIRKPPSCVSWIVTLSRLEVAAPGMQAKSVVQRWNKKAASKDLLQGAKAQAIKNCLELLPAHDRKHLVLCVSKQGWDKSPFTEEALATKKIYPGQYKPQHPNKQWATRAVVTNASSTLMWTKIVNKHHQQTLAGAPRMKINKVRMEAKAEEAACVRSFGEEMQQLVPVPESVLDSCYYAKYINGDPKLELEIQSVLSLKAPNAGPRDIPTLKLIIDSHAGPGASMNLAMAENRLAIDATKLEASTF